MRAIKHTYISSKMIKGKALMTDPVLSRHVPVTRWYSEDTLYKMLQSYPELYIKPDTGSGGTGIIRIRRLNRANSLVSFRKRTIQCPNYRIAAAVRKRMIKSQRYIIQQGISLATHRKRPFDLRVVLQKPSNRWLLTWMSAKVAPRQDAVVTNVAKGGRDAKIGEVLNRIDQRMNVAKVRNQLNQLSYRIANRLGSRLPVRLVGLDMAIDKNGKVWFIEANTKPNFHGLSKLDPVQYRRYMRVKRLMKARKLL